jgi:hypothetical protein
MKLLILGGKGEGTVFLYNAIKEKFNIDKLILEEPVPKSRLIKRRIKRLGIFKVFNQLLFQIFMVRWLNFFSKHRKNEILKDNELRRDPIPLAKTCYVETINSAMAISVIKQIDPDIILVSGTRIIGKKVLSCSNAKFINLHVGITPKYRGVHGGYWALANNDWENCGVTVHLVDQGIDTGKVLAQKTIKPTRFDNFVTYPYLQFSAGMAELENVLKYYQRYGSLPVFENDTSISTLYYHPTLTRYLYTYIVNGIK